ncbi:HAD domain-containing protein [Isoptericola sp. b441]|uniref:HAD domain-containing protein n=1 Tax=Actinotalea lenta TaxID=3064654 RepID=A0ABT9DA92_9CELL|nr:MULTISPECIES: HAD domain-containing protein [unclassified Isoptericola]MDO8105867.1 HAD domain-containing protein [Isoptericola sp. b441]MDO8122582.1 HAD domain-containing protein [Isoptericola sp. b490]
MVGPPWWFLDVDGVLNAFPPPPSGATTWSYRSLRVGAQGGVFTVTVADELLAALRDVHTTGQAEVVWCTTWGSDARDSLAPLLDLPDWPVAPRPDDIRCAPLPGWSAAPWWKLEAVSRWLDREPRPYVFTDDDLVPEVVEELRARHPGLPACLLRPSTTPGLGPTELRTVHEFLTRPAG